MIRNNFAVLLAQRKLKVKDISAATGISANGLYNLYYERPSGIQFHTLDVLCDYFDCNVGDIIQHVPNSTTE